MPHNTNIRHFYSKCCFKNTNLLSNMKIPGFTTYVGKILIAYTFSVKLLQWYTKFWLNRPRNKIKFHDRNFFAVVLNTIFII